MKGKTLRKQSLQGKTAALEDKTPNFAIVHVMFNSQQLT